MGADTRGRRAVMGKDALRQLVTPAPVAMPLSFLGACLGSFNGLDVTGAKRAGEAAALPSVRALPGAAMLLRG